MKFIKIIKADNKIYNEWMKFVKQKRKPIVDYLKKHYPYLKIYGDSDIVLSPTKQFWKGIVEELKDNFPSDIGKCKLQEDWSELEILPELTKFESNYKKEHNIKTEKENNNKEFEQDNDYPMGVDASNPSNFSEYLASCEAEDLAVACKYLKISPKEIGGESGLTYEDLYVEDMLDALHQKANTDELKVKVMKKIDKIYE